MGFMVPKPDTVRFCKHIAERYRLKSGVFSQQFADLFESLTAWSQYMDLSLRDIEDCFRSAVFVLKNQGENKKFPAIFVCSLIVLRLKHENLYRKYINKECTGAEVMNYIDEIVAREGGNQQSTRVLNIFEGSLYAYDGNQEVYQSLDRPKAERNLSREIFSNRIRGLGEDDINFIKNVIGGVERGFYFENLIRDVSTLIELTNIHS